MELVKLKMKKIYKVFLSLIFLLILLMLVIGIIYITTGRMPKFMSDIEVYDSLSVNYIDGKKIKVDKEEVINLSITNGSEEDRNYKFVFSKIRGDANYKILSNDEVVFEGVLKSKDEESTNYITINPKETKEYVIQFTNNDSNVFVANLNVRLQETKIETFADVILKNNEIKEISLTKVGVDIAKDNEGLIKTVDDLGTSYYFRGNVQNNYVNFANNIWRIVRINGDGTVKLVLNGETNSISNYYNTDDTDFSYEKSAINKYLENWYNENITDEEYIANSKFCNDINYDESNTYNAYTRIFVNKIPTLNCLGTIFSSNIGLLTIDEIIFAGANTTDTNNNYYLYNKNISNTWYTMSAAKSSNKTLNLFMVDTSGKININISGNLYRGVRPVINLVKNVQVTGNGTIDEPYQIKEK